MAALHPQVVHFTIALAVVGVLFRFVSLLRRPAFASPAATTLLLLAALASVVSVQSGEVARDQVERIPGAAAAVAVHEGWGEWARNALILLGAVELVGLAFQRGSKARTVNAAAAVVGVAALLCVFEAGEHGGELVYGYAGGVGTRSGDTKDVERLMVAGLYNQAMQDRKQGNGPAAAELLALAAKRLPSDVEVRLLAAESLLVDGGNPQGALEAYSAIEVTPGDRRLRTRRAMLQADAFLASNQKDAAIAVLQPIVEAFPDQVRVKQRVDELRAR